jgi:hypothetical protein
MKLDKLDKPIGLSAAPKMNHKSFHMHNGSKLLQLSKKPSIASSYYYQKPLLPSSKPKKKLMKKKVPEPIMKKSIS